LAEVGVRVMEIPILLTDVFGETARLRRLVQPITAAACYLKDRSVQRKAKDSCGGHQARKEESRI